MRQIKWDCRFMALAIQARTWVKGPDLGVGACIVSPDSRGISLGYSGLPRGVKDTEDRCSEPYFKDHMLVHAEVNAILNASQSVVGWTLYATTHPCGPCAAAMIQAGIARVVAPEPDEEAWRESRWNTSWKRARTMFEEAGVIFFPYQECMG